MRGTGRAPPGGRVPFPSSGERFCEPRRLPDAPSVSSTRSAVDGILASRGGAPARAKPRKAPGVPTLAESAAVVIGIQEKGWREGSRTRDAWEANLQRYAFPALGDLPISHVGAPELLEVVEPLWGTKRRPMDDMLNRVSVICKWAVAQGYRSDDPTPAVRAALPRNGRSRGHFAALPHAKVGEALAAIGKDDKRPMASKALQLCILTACRSGEARDFGGAFALDERDELRPAPALRVLAALLRRLLDCWTTLKGRVTTTSSPSP